jgi:hypothetical protein
MKALRPVSTIILAGLWSAGISGCSPVIANTPVSKSADGWELTLGQVKEGPNDYVGEGGILVEPADDQKLVWALLTVKNVGAREETLAYDKCTMNGPGQAFPPLVVDKNAGQEFNQPADKEESFEPGQDRTRLLVFPYPKDQRPASVRCGTITLPIKAAQ